MKREIRTYRSADGRSPFREWLDGLRDFAAKARIGLRLDRAAEGNLGQNRHLGEGLVEVKIDFGPGYRVYVGIQGQTLLILLCGGNKGSQQADINQAYEYWHDWKRNHEQI